MALHCYYQKVSGLVIILSLMTFNLAQSSSNINTCLNYCSGGSTCLETKDGLKCICLPNLTGERCDMLQNLTLTEQLRTSRVNRADPRTGCLYAPADFCKNGGTCYTDTTTNKYTCLCPFPYGQDFCTGYDACYNYCIGAATCVSTGNTATCTCPPDHTGARCEQFITPTTTVTTTATVTASVECAPAFPTNYCGSGTLVLFINKCICICPPNYTGSQCDQPANAPSTTFSPTLPTGVTGITPTGPTITGPTITPTNQYITCDQQPCLHGTCYPNGNSYYCFCGSQYSGTNCENVVG